MNLDQLLEVPAGAVGPVVLHVDEMLTKRSMALTGRADRVGISIVKTSRLKNGDVRAVRFNILTAICDALDCRPADLLTVTAAKRAR